MNATHLVLIGYRGTGKTTVARLLAAQLGRVAIDADLELVRRAGKPIAAIFAEEGELAFRDLESQVLGALLAGPAAVIAAGGGVVLRPENRRRLSAAGAVVWLRAAPETIERRLAADPSTPAMRPPLTAAGGPSEVRQLLAVREPLYAESATEIVDTDEKTPDVVADEILRRLNLLRPGTAAG